MGIRRELVLIVVSGVVVVGACATPPKIRPASAARKAHDPAQAPTATWWIAADPQRIEPPILGVEFENPPQSLRQYVFCERGVRIFDFQAGRLTHSSEPLPSVGTAPDEAVLRAAFRSLFNRFGAPENRDDCAERAENVHHVEWMIEILQACWPDRKSKGLEGMTYRGIREELEHFPYGVDQLIEAEKALE
jgi:hypothetical protein